MTAFHIISIATGLGLAAFLTYNRFKASTGAETKSFFSLATSYFSWLGRTLSRLLLREGWLGARSFYLSWLSRYPRSWQKWTLSGVILSFLYLAASGFGFALFSSRGLFGLVLFLHVGLGGVFCLGLAVLVVLRAKDYIAFPPAEASAGSLSAVTKTIPQPLLKSLLFWLFILYGLSLGLTALFSMLSYFTFEAQLILIGVHRYSGLVALVSAIFFLDQAIPRQKS
jgi:hypothetical protein